MAAADTAPALGAIAIPRLRSRSRTRAPAPPRLAPEALEFQNDLERLIEEPPPPLLGGGHYLVALFFASLLLVASLAKVDIVITGTGRLAADAPPLVVQPIERAVIREIRVRPGDIVTRGQILAVLDPTFAEADRAALAAQRRALMAQRLRVEAELLDRPPPPAIDADASLQAILHAQRRALHRSRMDGFAAEIGALEAGITALEDGAPALAEQLSIAQDVEALRLRLLEGQIGSRLNALAARSARLQAEQDQRQGRTRLAELRQSLAARIAEREGFRDDWQRQLLEELVRLRGDLARTEEQLAKATRLDEMTQLLAPADGVVLDVARRSVGSILREAEPLVTLVPAGTPLIAEITLRSADIGRLRGDDPVVLKVDAFPFQRHGTLPGLLRSVAQESGGRTEEGETRAGLHRGQVVLTEAALPNQPDGARLIPGMTISAEIHVGARSVISFFLYPLMRGFQESIREP